MNLTNDQGQWQSLFASIYAKMLSSRTDDGDDDHGGGGGGDDDYESTNIHVVLSDILKNA